MRFITEDDLRGRFGLGHGGEIRLEPDERLTPAAHNLVNERRIRVLHVNGTGTVAVLDEAGGLKRLPVLRTDTAGKMGKRCHLCGCNVKDKPEELTHLDGETLVPKTHPRIRLRGKFDLLTASIVLAQTELAEVKHLPREINAWLGDIRSWAGNLLRAEVTGEEIPEQGMGDWTFAVIHAVSHFPEKYLGHDHLVPEVAHGRIPAVLNRLRAEARETELAAARLLPERLDLVRVLNRMSSALYVLMLCARLCGQGKALPNPLDLGRTIKE